MEFNTKKSEPVEALIFSMFCRECDEKVRIYDDLHQQHSAWFYLLHDGLLKLYVHLQLPFFRGNHVCSFFFFVKVDKSFSLLFVFYFVIFFV